MPEDDAISPFSADRLGRGARDQWISLSMRAQREASGVHPCSANEELVGAAATNPQSPVAPAYLLWAADNLARESRFREAVSSYDTAIERAGSAERLMSTTDIGQAALHHRAQAAFLAGDTSLCVAAFRELAGVAPDPSEPLFEAGRAAEAAGRHDEAAELYERAGRATAGRVRTDSPAELARRALLRLQRADPTFAPDEWYLADLLSRALEQRDPGSLSVLASPTHFAVGPLAGHSRFESDSEVLEMLAADLARSGITVGRALLGSGAKRYLTTSNWRGEWFAGTVAFVLARCARGWEWTGLALAEPTGYWQEQWRPTQRQTNQPLPLQLLAPWPARQSFMAGGLTDFAAKSAAVAAAGLPLGPILAQRFSANSCGFGPRGFYYNQGGTHDEEDAFAIDFTRYRDGVPFDNESGGTPVLAPLDGVVVTACGGTSSGDDSASNTVEIMHDDPATGNPRFLSRYLHLQGPFRLSVSVGMAVITGQRLGRMNDTGNSLLDHLHFSVHDQTRPFPGAGPGCGRVTPGASVRPDPLNGTRLRDGDSARCVASTNLELVPGLNFRPTSISFGPVPVRDITIQTLRIENTAGREVTVAVPARTQGPFTWPRLQAVLPHRQDASLVVQFSPGAVGAATGTLTATSDLTSSPHTVKLGGTGVAGEPF